MAFSFSNEHCSRWRSYTSPQETHLAHSVTEAIDLLFQKVEERHGYLLVANCLAYVTAAKHGLSESEMEDVVSLDDEVIKIEETTRVLRVTLRFWTICTSIIFLLSVGSLLSSGLVSGVTCLATWWTVKLEG